VFEATGVIEYLEERFPDCCLTDEHGGGDSSSLASVVGAAAVPDDVTSINLAVTFELGGNGSADDAVLSGTVSSSGTFSPDPTGSAPTSIVTYGHFADGVTAQSISGGGGNAGFGSGNTQACGAGNDVTVNVGLGGKDGSGGDGGPVASCLG
jgi:hypothetical protein